MGVVKELRKKHDCIVKTLDMLDCNSAFEYRSEGLEEKEKGVVESELQRNNSRHKSDHALVKPFARLLRKHLRLLKVETFRHEFSKTPSDRRSEV
ncbi:hypothetical protein K0M31_003506 [Melipona bicolor]|uniref:Uncharacterized protein n=1 Tax=Melipona bicolor TaxID=60889 RepID=A0AA40FZ55_9HYME|nr:hypothetical protein K0M31_003506 [Melipona bicolor]